MHNRTKGKEPGSEMRESASDAMGYLLDSAPKFLAVIHKELLATAQNRHGASNSLRITGHPARRNPAEVGS